jgi:nucleoside-diphosphate-sugar epimerase
MKRVLITGATGFIGSHLVERCLQENYQIKVLVRSGHSMFEYFKNHGIEIVQGDIRDIGCLKRAVKDVQVVFHLASVVTDWAPKRLFVDVNIHGTEKLCHVSLIEGVERFIYMSTSDVFGFRDKSLIDESVEYQYWNEPYPDTKIEASRIVWEYFREGLPATIVYPCWVYGNGDRTLIPLLADAIRKKSLLF